MGRYEVTRRQLLAGVATAGGLGAVVGTGTGSMISDESVFGGSTIRSGSLDLAVGWETDEASGSDRGAVSIPLELSEREPIQRASLSVSLPDHDGGNNPAAVWVRSACPDEDDDLLKALDVTLRYAGCSNDCTVASGSLWELVDGVSLDARARTGGDSDDQRCLEPDESLDLELDVGIADYDGRGAATFTLEFVGLQCRNSGTVVPFTDTDCQPPEETRRPDISYLAFCTSRDEPIRPEILETRQGDDGPDLVYWHVETEVDYVCAKGGQTMTVYDFREDSRVRGAAWVGDPKAAVSSAHVEPGESARPCAVATDELAGGADDPERSIKLEYGSGHWKVANE